MNKIIFAGDSFVWGEGLELYIDTPYWISQRNTDNQWNNDYDGGLYNKQTNETKEFREKNRFVGIVEKKLNIQGIVNEKNGGDWNSANELVEKNLQNSNTIVYFCTSIDRNFLHFDINCTCDFCYDSKPKPFVVYTEYLEKVLNNKTIDKWTQSKIDYLEKNEGIPKFDIDYFKKYSETGDLITYVDKIFYSNRQKNIENQIKLFKRWKKTHNLYLIDSWCDYTSTNFLQNNYFLKSLMIPLKGQDGKWYKEYGKWQSTFPYKSIGNEFIKTNNGHPTLEQHKYLGESIVSSITKRLLI